MRYRFPHITLNAGWQGQWVRALSLKPKTRALCILACLALLGCGAGSEAAPPAEPTRTDFSYDLYNKVLSTYVDEDGMVDYAALKENRKPLDDFAAMMGELKPAVYEGWSEAAQLAFWINTYNAFTLVAIIDQYPIDGGGGLIASVRFPDNSIRQIPGVWDELEWTVLGERHTLEHIEHEIIRKDFSEPRIHMALVCAAMSCPKLRNEAFTGERLDAQLEDQSKQFVQHSEKVRIDHEKDTVHLSAIFNWFGEDFVPKYGTRNKFTDFGETETAILNFVSQYTSAENRNYLETGDYDIDYLDYDWSLNEQR